MVGTTINRFGKRLQSVDFSVAEDFKNDKGRLWGTLLAQYHSQSRQKFGLVPGRRHDKDTVSSRRRKAQMLVPGATMNESQLLGDFDGVLKAIAAVSRIVRNASDFSLAGFLDPDGIQYSNAAADAFDGCTFSGSGHSSDIRNNGALFSIAGPIPRDDC